MYELKQELQNLKDKCSGCGKITLIVNKELSLCKKCWEKRAILEALRITKGNASSAADALGWGRATLYRKIKQYDIEKK